MGKDYFIAGLRVRIEHVEQVFPDAGSALARAFEAFVAPEEKLYRGGEDGLGEEYSPIVMRLRPGDAEIGDNLQIQSKILLFNGAVSGCFGRSERGYLFEMQERVGGHRMRLFKPLEGPEVFLAGMPMDKGNGSPVAWSPLAKAMLKFGLLMVFGVCAAMEAQAVAMHASAIECGGRTVLFLGESGTGKSTHTRLWREHIRGAQLLNDDAPMVRLVNGIPMAFGSPWSGKTPCYHNLAYPIAGIVRLSQAPRNRIERLTGAAAFAAILPSVTSIYRHDAALQTHILALLGSLCERVPIFRMECLPDREAALMVCEQVLGETIDPANV